MSVHVANLPYLQRIIGTDHSPKVHCTLKNLKGYFKFFKTSSLIFPFERMCGLSGFSCFYYSEPTKFYHMIIVLESKEIEYIFQSCR